MIDRMDTPDGLKSLSNEDPNNPSMNFLWDHEDHPPMMSMVCIFCAHLSQNVARQCAAFEYIPDDIWHARNNHRKPYPGDHGIQFAPREEKASEE